MHCRSTNHSLTYRYPLSLLLAFSNLLTRKGDLGQAHTHRTSWSVLSVSAGLKTTSRADMATYSSNMGHLPLAVYEARRISPSLIQPGGEDKADFDNIETVAVRCQKE